MPAFLWRLLRAKRSGKDQEAINQLLAQREQLKLLPRKRVIKSITDITQKNITKIINCGIMEQIL